MSKQNFLANFSMFEELDAVSFMKIWSHYDTDQSGSLDSPEEIEAFARDLLAAGGGEVTELQLKDLLAGLSELCDTDGDGSLGLAELAGFLPVEANFLDHFNGREPLTQSQLEEIFGHYDTDGSGTIQGDELAALMRDLLRRFDREPTKAEIDLYTAQIMGFIDADANAGLDLAELSRLFPKG